MDFHTSASTITGAPLNSGKTSLLFQFAVNAAFPGEALDPVVFICKRTRLEAKPPILSQGVDASCDCINRVHMKYIENDEGIKRYFSAFHLHERPPSAVVIDDFVELFDERNCIEKYGNPRGRDLAMIRVLALCYSAVMHQSNTTCRILLCDTHQGDSPRLLYIYKRWVSSFFVIKCDGMGSFYLKAWNDNRSDEHKSVRIAKFCVALHYLSLEEIVDDDELKLPE